VGELVIMPVKLLLREKNELRLRIIGESHTALQMLRERLNSHKNVEYANYFPGHPELDDPEFYIRTKGKSASDKILRELVSDLAGEFASTSL
jgi:DNA-directed RNA polymerase subunit L